jgi:hypothetical protein
MRYQEFPFLGDRTNKLLMFEWEDLTIPKYLYRHEDGVFTKVEGAISEDHFDSPKVVLPPSAGFTFDACADQDAYRNNSYRGKRRRHALHLAANYRQQTVLIWEKWLPEETKDKFKVVLDKLKAFVQGTRVTFATAPNGEFYYQINKPLMESIYRDLESIRKRTLQKNPDREEDIFELPIWSDTKLTDVYKGVYTKNDWEILAATFRMEVETFLLAMDYSNYDFLPPEEKPEDEEYCEPFVVQDLSPEVAKILEDSMKIITRHIHPNNSYLSDSFRYGALTSTSARRQAPNPTDLNNESEEDSGSQGEQLFDQEVISSTPQRIPTSALPRGPSITLEQKIHKPTSLSRASLPVVTLAPASQAARDSIHDSSDNQFAPIDPVGQANIVPDFQEEQINRIYQAPPDSLEPVLPGTGTAAFNKLIEPNRYAKEANLEGLQVPSQDESPGRARSAFASGIRDPSSIPSVSFDLGHSTGTQSQLSPQSNFLSGNPTLLTRPTGNGHRHISLPSIGPGGPPGDDPDDDPDRPPGRGPPNGPPSGGNGFPGGNGNGSPDRDNPNQGQPNQGPPGGPPGPPDPSTGGAVDPPDNRPRKDYIVSGLNKTVRTYETHFDTKLKPDIVPTWNGDDSTIIRWLTQVDELAQRSLSVFKGLGDIVPTRFRERAASWWFSLPPEHRNTVTANWDTLKKEIRAYWMNQAWIEKIQLRANRCKYRESGHASETPTEYVIRKLELMSYVYNYTTSQTMSEILTKAPRMWSTVVNPRNFKDLASFQTAIKYHEDLLIDLGERYDKYERRNQPHQSSSRSYKVDSKPRFKGTRIKDSKGKSSRNYAIGWNNPKQSYPHPKDDSNVSKGKTPADYGARGCIFCGSKKHWDCDCKHFKDDTIHKARTMFTDCTSDEMHAEAEYERCYQESQEDLDDSETSSEEEAEQTGELRSEHSDEEHSDF